MCDKVYFSPTVAANTDRIDRYLQRDKNAKKRNTHSHMHKTSIVSTNIENMKSHSAGLSTCEAQGNG